MGAAAAVVQALSCADCAKYVCNALSIHSQCCDKEDACNCDLETKEVGVQPGTPDLHAACPWVV